MIDAPLLPSRYITRFDLPSLKVGIFKVLLMCNDAHAI